MCVLDVASDWARRASTAIGQLLGEHLQRVSRVGAVEGSVPRRARGCDRLTRNTRDAELVGQGAYPIVRPLLAFDDRRAATTDPPYSTYPLVLSGWSVDLFGLPTRSSGPSADWPASRPSSEGSAAAVKAIASSRVSAPPALDRQERQPVRSQFTRPENSERYTSIASAVPCPEKWWAKHLRHALRCRPDEPKPRPPASPHLRLGSTAAGVALGRLSPAFRSRGIGPARRARSSRHRLVEYTPGNASLSRRRARRSAQFAARSRG